MMEQYEIGDTSSFDGPGIAQKDYLVLQNNNAIQIWKHVKENEYELVSKNNTVINLDDSFKFSYEPKTDKK